MDFCITHPGPYDRVVYAQVLWSILRKGLFEG
jgi:hypothetical protein